MEELKRIFLNKSIIAVFIFLLLLNGMLFVQMSEKDNGVFRFYKDELEKYIDTDTKEAAEDIENKISKISVFYEIRENMELLNAGIYGEAITESANGQLEYLKHANSEYYNEYIKNASYYETIDFDEYMTALNKLRDQITYIDSFDERYENMLEKAKLMEMTTIFGSADTFSLKNIEKTLKDFESFKEIKTELGYDRTIIDLYEFTVTDFIIIGFMCVIAIMLIKERRLGLWSVIRTCKNGRGKLAATRYVAIIIFATITSVIFYLENIILGKIIYKEQIDFSRNIQSIQEFVGCRYDITILEYVGLHILMKIFAFVLIGSIMWLVVSAFNNVALAVACIVMVVAVEYSLFTYIPIQSNFNILRFMNIFSILFINREFAEYLNFEMNGKPVNTLDLCIMYGMVMLLVFGTAVIIVNIKKRAVVSKSSFSHIWDLIKRKICIFKGGVNSFLTEVYKVFFMQKGIFIYLLLIFVCVLGYKDEKYQEDSYYKILQGYYNEVEGPVTEEKIAYIENLKEEINLQYENGTVNPIIKLQEKVVNILAEKLEAYDEIKERTGVEIWFVNQGAYDEMFGSHAYSRHILYAIMIMLFVVIILATIFSVENQNRAGLMVRSTLKGRRYTLLLKMLVSAITVIAVMIPVYVLEICNVKTNFNFTSLSAPVQSIDIFRKFPIKISIVQFFVFIYILRFLVLYCMAVLIMVVSQKVSASSEAIMLNIAIFIMPSAMYYIGIKGFKYLSFASFAAIIENIGKGKAETIFIAVGYLLIFVLGAAGFSALSKKWVNAG